MSDPVRRPPVRVIINTGSRIRTTSATQVYRQVQPPCPRCKGFPMLSGEQRCETCGGTGELQSAA
jgi:hypothetical protein